ncbi:unnamed protein product, partial [Meganyctiphanes norvegica]
MPSTQAPSRIPRLATSSFRRQGLFPAPQNPKNNTSHAVPISNTANLNNAECGKNRSKTNGDITTSKLINSSSPSKNCTIVPSKKSSYNSGIPLPTGTSEIPLPSKVPLQLAQAEAMPTKPPSRFKRLKSFIKHGSKGTNQSKSNIEARNTRIGSAETVSTLIAMNGPSVSTTPSPTTSPTLISSPSQQTPSPMTPSPLSPPMLHTPDCPYKTNPMLSFRYSNISFPKSPSNEDMETKHFEQNTEKTLATNPLPEFCSLKADQTISGSHFSSAEISATSDHTKDFPFISSKPCSFSTPIHKSNLPINVNPPSFKINPGTSAHKKTEESQQYSREGSPYPKINILSKPCLSSRSSPSTSLSKYKQETYHTRNAHFITKEND